MNVPFNKVLVGEPEMRNVIEVMRSTELVGGGEYSKRCEEWFEENVGCRRALLTPSCTHALEFAALLFNVSPGDEVIMPSYTFVSTANAFVLRGAKVVFVDIRPDTMNLNEQLIEEAITERTKAIVPVHYAGVGCEMDLIIELAKRHNLFVVEDAAQGMMGFYKGRPLGSIGHLGCYSFHGTKNYCSGGEGGVLLINDPSLVERAEILREKGTNRKKFLEGRIDKYSWVDVGSSYLPSEIQAAYLLGQIERVEEIRKGRLRTWNLYNQRLRPLERYSGIEIQNVPTHCQHNGHMFFMKARNLEERRELLRILRENGFEACFHYIPLHSAPAGKMHGRFMGEDVYTTRDSERIVRLPIWNGMDDSDVEAICDSIERYYKTHARQ